MPVNFQPSRIFVEYHSQFLIVSNEIRTIGLGLKIRIDRCWNCHKRIEFAGYLRDSLFLLMWHGVHEIICLILAQNSQLHTH